MFLMPLNSYRNDGKHGGATDHFKYDDFQHNANNNKDQIILVFQYLA